MAHLTDGLQNFIINIREGEIQALEAAHALQHVHKIAPTLAALHHAIILDDRHDYHGILLRCTHALCAELHLATRPCLIILKKVSLIAKLSDYAGFSRTIRGQTSKYGAELPVLKRKPAKHKRADITVTCRCFSLHSGRGC